MKNNCTEGPDPNKEQSSRARKDWEWEIVVKMTLISRNLMIGNSKLAEAGFSEDALGNNAIAGGFEGQQHWTDFYPNGVKEAIPKEPITGPAGLLDHCMGNVSIM